MAFGRLGGYARQRSRRAAIRANRAPQRVSGRINAGRRPAGRAAVPVFTPPARRQVARRQRREPRRQAAVPVVAPRQRQQVQARQRADAQRARRVARQRRQAQAELRRRARGVPIVSQRPGGKVSGRVNAGRSFDTGKVGTRSESIPETAARIAGGQIGLAARRAGTITSPLGVYYRRPATRGRARDLETQVDVSVRGAARSGAITPFSLSVPGKALQETMRAGLEQPGTVGLRTAAGLRDAAAAVPGGLLLLATNPAKAVKLAKDDYVRRYADLAGPGGREKFRERIKKEGAGPEVLDFAAVGAGAGGGISRGIGAIGRAKGAKFMTAERPKLRYSGGGGVKRQELSKGVVGVARQRAVDRRRQAAQERRNRKAREQGRGVYPVQAGPGEVVPRTVRKMERMQRRESVARRGAQNLEAQRNEQAREVGAVRKARARLTKPESRALFYAAEGTVPLDPAQARRWLAARREWIVANREKSGKQPRRQQADELPTIDYLIRNAEKAFTPNLKAVVAEARGVQRRTEASDPAVPADVALGRRYAGQAEILGLAPRGSSGSQLLDEATPSPRPYERSTRAETETGETAEDFAKRVGSEGGKRGLSEPMYVPNRKRWADNYSYYVPGQKRAVADPKRYTGELLRTGRRVTRPELLDQAVALNVKRKFNWNAVAQTVEGNALDIKPGTFDQVMSRLERAEVDTSKVALWDPRRYYAARKEVEREAGDTEIDELGNRQVYDALRAAKLDAPKPGALTDIGDFAKSSGLLAVPKKVMDELEASARPSNAPLRSFEIVKGKQARYMLAFANVPWIQFQVASNAILAGFATGGRATDAVKAQLWWRKLTQEQRDAIEPVMGAGPFKGDLRQTKLGASADNQLVNAWRAFKEVPAFRNGLLRGRGPSVADLNPIDLMFRFDTAQNNFFRRAVLYNKVKREAYRQMGENASAAAKLQDRVAGIMSLGPEERMRKILDEPQTMELMAEKVNDFLGDYMTFTAAERRVLGRFVMFYGFTRFSLKMVFYTLPNKHPTAMAIMGKLGQLQADEIKRFLGGDQMPWITGRVFFGDLSDPKKRRSIDVSRANPALNVLVGMRTPSQVFSVLPPFVVSTLIELPLGTNVFKDKKWRVNEQAQRIQQRSEAGPSATARVWTAGQLRTLAPYRMAEDVVLRGPQGDDSLIFAPRPTRFKDKEIRRSVKQQRKLESEGLQRVVETVTPFVPRRDLSPEIAGKMRESKKPKRKKSSGSSLLGGGGGGGSGGSTLMKEASSGGGSSLMGGR